MAGINFGNTTYGNSFALRAKALAQPKPDLPEIKGDGIKKLNDPSVRPNSVEPALPPADEKRTDKPSLDGMA